MLGIRPADIVAKRAPVCAVDVVVVFQKSAISIVVRIVVADHIEVVPMYVQWVVRAAQAVYFAHVIKSELNHFARYEMKHLSARARLLVGTTLRTLGERLARINGEKGHFFGHVKLFAVDGRARLGLTGEMQIEVVLVELARTVGAPEKIGVRRRSQRFEFVGVDALEAIVAPISKWTVHGETRSGGAALFKVERHVSF